MFNHYQLIRYASKEAYLDNHETIIEEMMYEKRYKIEHVIEARHGLYALLIADTSDDTYAIIFRGSDTKGIRFLKNWFQTNIPNAIGSNISSKMSEHVFYESVLLYQSLTTGKEFQDEHQIINGDRKYYKITHVCGNSLGGTHAMLIGALFPEVQAVTINPGPIVKTFRNVIKEVGVFDNITNYITEHDSLFKGVQLTNRLDDILGEKIIVSQTPIKTNDLIYRHRGVDVDLMIYRYINHNTVVKATHFFVEKKSKYDYKELEIMWIEKQRQIEIQVKDFMQITQEHLMEIDQLQTTLLASIERFINQLTSTLLTTNYEKTLLFKQLFEHRFRHLFDLYHADGEYYQHLLDVLQTRLKGVSEASEIITIRLNPIKQDKLDLEEGIVLLIDEMITHYTDKSFTHLLPYLIKIEITQYQALIDKMIMDQSLLNRYKEMIELHNASYHLMSLVLYENNRSNDLNNVKILIKQGELR